MFIKEVILKVIKDSRGEETIQVTVKTYKGVFSASAPSGKSKGRHETASYNARGVKWSAKMCRVFARTLEHKNFIFKNFSDLKKLEEVIKKFEARFGKLGANSIYAIETAFLKAAAGEQGKELWQFINDFCNEGKKPKIPMPVGNCIGGGKHSKGKKPDFQEFLLIPKEKTFSKAVTKNIHAYFYAKKLIKQNQKSWLIRRNDEGAWETKLTNEETLEVLNELKKKYGLRIGIDAAASSFYKNGYYNYENKRLIRDRKEQIDYMEYIIQKFGLFYVEDAVQEEDVNGFLELNNNLKSKSLIVGDDLTVTNYLRTRSVVRSKAINAMIIKPNQVGSLLEVKKVVDFCKENNIIMIFSHRSGETMDDAIADYCIGFGGDFVKFGIYGRERLIKLRRIMEIEKSLKHF